MSDEAVPIKITFLPIARSVEGEANQKILLIARKNKIPLRFGCASCRCGTCAVKVSGAGQLSAMDEEERKLLARMQLSTSGDVRLTCRARVLDGQVDVDLSFQNTYSPDDFDLDDNA